MSCPKCGLQVTAGQRFCRSCGASLQETVERGSGFLFWGFITMLLGIVIGVLGKKLVHDDIVTVAGVLISLVGMFVVAYPYLVPKRKPGTESPTKDLSRSEPAKYLPNGSNIEYVPSVTEVQTDLLSNSAVRLEQKNNDEAERATKKMEQP